MATGERRKRKVGPRGYSFSRAEWARRRARRDLEAKKIDQREHDRRVAAADEAEAEFMARKPERTIVIGTVGHVTSLYKTIDDRLRELDMNWETLARRIPCAKQYLSNLTEQSRAPHDMILRIFGILGIDPAQHITNE